MQIHKWPPWEYNDRTAGAGRKFGLGACQYDLMPIEDIKAMRIKDITDKNCALFLWVTFPFLQEGLDVIKAWNFEYKTQAFTWIKLNQKNYKPFFGIGYYTKSNPEICLLGIKGKMKPITNTISSVVMEPIREHSRKPDIVRENIVKLFGDLPRLELFCREQKEGWNVFGNQLDKFEDDQISFIDYEKQMELENAS